MAAGGSLAWWCGIGRPKTIVGYDAGIPCTAKHWLAALDMAVSHQYPAGVRDQGLALMSDRGGQPTALAFMRACSTLGIQQASTSDHHPKGDADAERVMRTLTEEGLWLQEWTSLVTLIRALEDWMADYHEQYLHAARGYQSPSRFERDYHDSHGTPFAAA